jgi:microcystin-dependent protein
MANIIKPKRSYTATNTPTLASGELGINAADGKIYLGNATGSANVLVGSLNRSDHTGTLAVANGGTGLTTLTANNVILGNGTSTPSFVAPGSSGNLLTSNGTTWQSTTPAASSSMPTGALMPYAGSTAPTGYLLCDGSSVSSSTYLALHAVISNTYGGSAYTGGAGLNFTLPDLRGRLPMGAGSGVGLNSSGTGAPSGTAQTARTRGQWLGRETVTLASGNIPQISTGNMSANANHNHQIGTNIFLRYVGSGGNRGDYQTNPNSWTGTANNDGVTTASTSVEHSHTVGSASPTGVATIPPVVVLNYIIKT